MAWGTHFCHFYRTPEELFETVSTYFQAGREHGQRCVWLTAGAVTSPAALEVLRAALPALEIVDCENAPASAAGWLDRERHALLEGASGLRLASLGSCERGATEAVASRRIMALCSYSLERCSADEVLDVIAAHQFAIVRRDGRWIQLGSDARLNELRDALQARDQLLSIAAHELKTPISSLRLQVEGLARAVGTHRFDPVKAVEKLDRARDQCARLEALVERLVDAARMRSGPFPVVLDEVDYAELARGVRERFREELERLGRVLELNVPPALPGRSDRVRVEQVLTNLISNAIKHAPDSPIAVTVRAEDDRVSVEVSDSGPGIASDSQAAVFEPFRQMPEAVDRGGVGLGLWIVRRIVESLRGEIRLRSEPGQGATFTVKLPRGT